MILTTVTTFLFNENCILFGGSINLKISIFWYFLLDYIIVFQRTLWKFPKKYKFHLGTETI